MINTLIVSYYRESIYILQACTRRNLTFDLIFLPSYITIKFLIIIMKCKLIMLCILILSIFERKEVVESFMNAFMNNSSSWLAILDRLRLSHFSHLYTLHTLCCKAIKLYTLLTTLSYTTIV